MYTHAKYFICECNSIYSISILVHFALFYSILFKSKFWRILFVKENECSLNLFLQIFQEA